MFKDVNIFSCLGGIVYIEGKHILFAHTRPFSSYTIEMGVSYIKHKEGATGQKLSLSSIPETSEPKFFQMTIRDYISALCFQKHIHSSSLHWSLETQLNYTEQGYATAEGSCSH